MKQTTYNINQIVEHFNQIKPWLTVPETEAENEALIHFARDLREAAKKGKKAAADLLPLVLEHIEAYEKRTYMVPKVEPHEVLAFLMEQHHLTQHDLPEIGSQSLVSKILNGERKLTLNHVEQLSVRFNISPNLFFGI